MGGEVEGGGDSEGFVGLAGFAGFAGLAGLGFWDEGERGGEETGEGEIEGAEEEWGETRED